MIPLGRTSDGCALLGHSLPEGLKHNVGNGRPPTVVDHFKAWAPSGYFAALDENDQRVCGPRRLVIVAAGASRSSRSHALRDLDADPSRALALRALAESAAAALLDGGETSVAALPDGGATLVLHGGGPSAREAAGAVARAVAGGATSAARRALVLEARCLAVPAGPPGTEEFARARCARARAPCSRRAARRGGGARS